MGKAEKRAREEVAEPSAAELAEAKRQRKEAKRAAKAAAAAAAAEAEVAAAAPAPAPEDDEAVAKRARKEAKRKRKAEAAAAAAAAAGESAAAQADEEDVAERKRRRKEEKRRQKAAAAAAAATRSPKSAPARSPRAAPAKSPKAAPAKSPKQAPAKSPKAAPASSPKTGPAKSPKAPPAKSPKSAPAAAATPAVAAWRKEHAVTVDSRAAAFPPALTFAESGLPKDILQCTSSFARPSPIQAQCWPIIQAGRDVIGIAKTGSGKTYAFMLPALAHCRQHAKKGKPVCRVLALAPTRELCTQIAKVGHEAADPCGMRVACLYGGVPKQQQRNELHQGVHVIVATPGRLLDLCDEQHADLSQVNYAVLDEADRMLDMGFEPDVRRIFKQVSEKRQTVMFSATWPEAIQELAREFLQTPCRVTIGSEGLQANRDITQKVEVIDDREKFPRLLKLLQKYHGSRDNRVLVFGLYKRECARLENDLWNKGWKAVAIHGDNSQAQRNKAFESFKSGETPLLVATDVAARGLDIKGVEYVINYSFPLTVEDYVHRIGRTGRAGVPGFAHTFFTHHDKQLGPELIKVLEGAGQAVPKELEAYRHVAPKKAPAKLQRHALESKSGGFKGDSVSGNRTTFDLDSD
eukprot:TRINITY_DN1766_c0_g1_i1.p1 TRINITY_DN1766_c0_g1~~TRINITY_DN1766_c0_g1_i1.p1  ORF type:complete len:635 (+),score=172.34 TRINITY_DN1766_c0_g1_i1:132-2036(+)